MLLLALDTLQALLLSSEWAVNNSLLPEEIARANNNNFNNDNSNNNNSSDSNKYENSNNNGGIFRFPKSSYPDSSASQEQLQLQQGQKNKSPKILPLKSFRNELFDLNVVAHTFYF